MTRALDRIVELGDRFADLAVAVDPATPVAGSPGWSVRDVVAHVATVVPRYAAGPEGGGDWVDDPSDLPAMNGRLLDELGPEHVGELLARIRSDVRSLAEQVRSYGDAVPSFAFNGGETVAADDALGILAGEFLVHGRDIAVAGGRDWRLSTEDVRLVLDGIEPVLPGFVAPAAAGHTATYDIRLRGDGARRWRFDAGRLDCSPDAETSVDCHLSGVPADLLLVMYGRVPPWRPALTGKVVAWGRRPWLALVLPGRFHNP